MKFLTAAGGLPPAPLPPQPVPQPFAGGAIAAAAGGLPPPQPAAPVAAAGGAAAGVAPLPQPGGGTAVPPAQPAAGQRHGLQQPGYQPQQPGVSQPLPQQRGLPQHGLQQPGLPQPGLQQQHYLYYGHQSAADLQPAYPGGMAYPIGHPYALQPPLAGACEVPAAAAAVVNPGAAFAVDLNQLKQRQDDCNTINRIMGGFQKTMGSPLFTGPPVTPSSSPTISARQDRLVDAFRTASAGALLIEKDGPSASGTVIKA